MAAKHFAVVAEDPTADPVQKIMNAALFASAEGDWQRATTELQKILAADPENFVAVNNLAVALLNQGRLQEVCDVSRRRGKVTGILTSSVGHRGPGDGTPHLTLCDRHSGAIFIQPLYVY